MAKQHRTVALTRGLKTVALIWADTRLPVLAGELAEDEWIEIVLRTGEVKRLPTKDNGDGEAA